MSFQLGEEFSNLTEMEEKSRVLNEKQLRLGFNLTTPDSKMWQDKDNESLLKSKNKYKYMISGCESMGAHRSRGLGLRKRK